ncbi:hypothetical protein V7S43_008640 [Phytophthora oleae]|uniref:Uncharacterized protein n=1 Tax=Phytophthora oleae TaxID=2107226 RepID=A0ABD3FI14_9STRA
MSDLQGKMETELLGVRGSKAEAAVSAAEGAVQASCDVQQTSHGQRAPGGDRLVHERHNRSMRHRFYGFNELHLTTLRHVWETNAFAVASGRGTPYAFNARHLRGNHVECRTFSVCSKLISADGTWANTRRRESKLSQSGQPNGRTNAEDGLGGAEIKAPALQAAGRRQCSTDARPAGFAHREVVGTSVKAWDCGAEALACPFSIIPSPAPGAWKRGQMAVADEEDDSGTREDECSWWMSVSTICRRESVPA